jgi:signal transduction histidine kinase/CheY-like chemotaxis protein
LIFRSNLFARLLILVVAATLPALLVLVYLQQDLRRDRLAGIPHTALQQAELINADMRSVMEGARQLAVAIARFSTVRALDPRCVSHMREVQDDLPSYAVVSVRDSTGALVCSSNPEAATADLAQHCLHPPLGRAPAAGPGLGEVRIGLFTPASAHRGPVLPICIPFAALQDRIGYVVMELCLEWLSDHIAEMSLPASSIVNIADRDGTLLVRMPGPDRFIGSALPAAMLPAVAAAHPGARWGPGLDDRERIYGFLPATQAPHGMFVSVGLFAPDILADLDVVAWQGLVMMGMGMVVSLVLAFFAGERFIRRPTAALLDAARRWSEGNLQARAQPLEAPSSEFGRLARAFNLMAEALGRRRAELVELNATLEARVRDRTRDLEQSRNRLQHEIAERERTEAELHQAHKFQAVGQLAGGIAHDFNNLLTAIVGALDLVRRRLPPEQQALRPLVANALEAAQRGARLTSQLLAFSRRQRLLPVPTDLNVPVLALTGLLASTLGRNIRIETDLAAELWPAMVDPTQVEAVILNLAINGRDAMKDGGVLAIRTRNLHLGSDDPDRHAAPHAVPPGDYVVLEVADTGAGMSPEVKERAFEPFFTTKPQGEGGGLGLSQVHGLALQSGGDVRIDSRPGFGTTVTVLLPRAGSGLAPVPASSALPPRVRLRPLRVLVVDDDRAVREMTGEMLAERGHSVVLAADGAAALALLDSPAAHARPFDLLLVDYVMPGMNGVALIQAAQVLHPALRALLITGNAETDTAEAIDADRVMRKPFTIAQLEARMARLMDGARVALPHSS